MKINNLQAFLICALSVLYTMPARSQQWGYATLIAPQNATTVSLYDTNSTVVKQWTGLNGQTAYSSYLMPGGYLWRAVKNNNNSFNGGGITGRVQKVDWNGTILFDYVISNSTQCSHHDIHPMPNGNVLIISYELKTAAEVTAAGCTANATRWSEKILELQPTGTNTANIVWEWHLWDHLAQNVDPNKPNYQSSIVNHPELLNVNYNNTGNDWVHMNGIDYNPTLDQIVVSSHYLNELWVIDHSTTTAQAATHSGGNAGKGGDLLYRWGNPAAYGASGTATFHIVHDAHWVPEGCPRAGYLGGFNNQGVSNNKSSIDLLNPPLNGYNYDITAGQAYLPATYEYRHTVNGYSSNMGSSQQLPNGNMLISVATASKVYEIDSTGAQVWQYTGTSALPKAFRYSRCYIENPVITVNNANPAICPGVSAQLGISTSATNQNSFTYNWSPALGLSDPNAEDPTVSGITAPITYTVTATSASGCTATASVSLSIASPPNADAGNNVAIQPGQSATLNASGGVSYLWSTGQNAATISVNPLSSTLYTVTVTGANGCTATDQVVVSILSGSLSVAISATDSLVCDGDVAQLFANPSGGTGNYTYAWTSNPAGFSSNIFNPYINPSVSTTYQVLVTDGSETATASLTIGVNPLPPQPSITADGNALLSSAATQNQWFYYGNPIPDATGQIYNPTLDGSYQVQTTDANGCPSPLSDPIEYVMVGLATPAGADQWSLSPNPASQMVHINGLPGNVSPDIVLYNLTGARIVGYPHTNVFSVSNLDNGIYFVAVTTPQGSSVRKLLVLK